MSKILSASSVTGKETIYVDVDDEITAIIDKVESAKSKVVALVLPKRSQVLQSVVNMKLLKRTADNSNKNLVLITSEAGLMPLAGIVGMYVATTPTSKPSIPAAPQTQSDEPEDIEEPLNMADGTAEESDFDADAVGDKPVGELAAAGTAGVTASKLLTDDDDTIDMANDDTTSVPDTAPPQKVKKLKKDKNLKIPNFDSFRKKIALAIVVLALLIGGFIFASKVLPTATVEIKTDTSIVPTNVNLAVSTKISKLDLTNNAVPAIVQSQQKSATQQVPATGQQNNGQQASGKVNFTAKKCSAPIGVAPSTLATGSSVSSGGKTYILQESATFGFSGFSSGGSCANYSTGNTDIQALKAGTDYNTSSGSTFTANNGTSGSGSAVGGTDVIVKVVSQTDIDNATNQIKAADNSDVLTQLTSALQAKGQLPIKSTFVAGTPLVTTSAKAGETADTVTVTAATTYTLLGVQKSDISSIIMTNVDHQIDKSKQTVLDDGVLSAKYVVQGTASDSSATLAMSAKTVAGPQLDADKLKKALAGKKSGNIKSYLTQIPGVTGVDVKFGPFWVNTVPSNPTKVTIKIDKTKF